jgi:hypothetical protein
MKVASSNLVCWVAQWSIACIVVYVPFRGQKVIFSDANEMSVVKIKVCVSFDQSIPRSTCILNEEDEMGVVENLSRKNER